MGRFSTSWVWPGARDVENFLDFIVGCVQFSEKKTISDGVVIIFRKFSANSQKSQENLVSCFDLI